MGADIYTSLGTSGAVAVVMGIAIRWLVGKLDKSERKNEALVERYDKLVERMIPVFESTQAALKSAQETSIRGQVVVDKAIEEMEWMRQQTREREG